MKNLSVIIFIILFATACRPDANTWTGYTDNGGATVKFITTRDNITAYEVSDPKQPLFLFKKEGVKQNNIFWAIDGTRYEFCGTSLFIEGPKEREYFYNN